MRHIFSLLVIAIALVVAFARPAPGGEAAAITIDPDHEQSVQPALLSEVKKLLASDAQAGDRFGLSTAVSGDTAVVGAPSEDAGGNNAGAAYVFEGLAPSAVGGIVEVVSDPSDSPQRQTGGSNSSALLYAIVGGTATIALAAGGWYARRRVNEGVIRRLCHVDVRMPR